MTACLRVITPGPFTTIQDSGRYGYRRFGVPPSGALDRFAHATANLLVGNPSHAAALEFTFLGGAFDVLAEMQVAVTGDLLVHLNGRPLCCWRSYRVVPGARLHIGQVRSGCRSYLAVGGGLNVPEVMGSRACYTGAWIGGYQGRPLASGDILELLEDTGVHQDLRLPEDRIPVYASKVTLRALPGPQEEYFDGGMHALTRHAYQVSPEAGRTGYRLDGAPITIAPNALSSIISEPAIPGSVQIPANGQPIILLNEQTVGGYAKIATIIQPDIDRMAQMVPGDEVQFEAISLTEAHRIRYAYDTRLGNLDRELVRVNATGVLASDMSPDVLSGEDPDGFADRINRYLIQI